MRPPALVTLVVAALLAGCGAADPDPVLSQRDASSTPLTVPPSPSTSQAADGALDDRLASVLGLLEGAELSADEYGQAFASSFIDQVPYGQFQQITEQIGQSAPWTVEEERARTEDAVSVALVGADGSRVVLDLAVDAEGRIDELLVQPGEAPTLDEQPSSIEEAMGRLTELGTLRWAAHEVNGGECTAIAGDGADEQVPIGSAFKLYVLGAVIERIGDDELAWDDELEITGEVRSLPSGVLQDRPAGATVTVEEAARLMISISDNTATDLLLRTVGREAVERAQADWGHSEPGRNVPLPTTRELFVLKTSDQATRTTWLDGGEPGRRELLDRLAGEPLPPVSAFTGQPLQPDQIEWFASPHDLCRVMAQLRVAADEPGLEPLGDILTSNGGVPAGGQWESVWFKGGSEPGLLAVTFLVTDDRGASHALTGSVVNTDEAFDQTRAVLLFAAARDLLPGG